MTYKYILMGKTVSSKELKLNYLIEIAKTDGAYHSAYCDKIKIKNNQLIINGTITPMEQVKKIKVIVQGGLDK